MATLRACASIEFWTSSATALRGSDREAGEPADQIEREHADARSSARRSAASAPAAMDTSAVGAGSGRRSYANYVGLLADYGVRTRLSVLFAHVVFGIILGPFYVVAPG